MDQFNGQVGIVTGGGSGIGLAIATRLQNEGVRIALLDLNEDALTKARAQLGSNGN